ncbi:MAG: hypothetical protein IJR88_03470 [Clostridia bacterium]|nr:hypothetical protein [Clostridia bacterium]
MEKNFFKKAVSSLSKRWKELTGQGAEEQEESFVPVTEEPVTQPEAPAPEPEPTKFGEQLSIDLAAKQEEVEKEPQVTPTPSKKQVVSSAPVAEEAPAAPVAEPVPKVEPAVAEPAPAAKPAKEAPKAEEEASDAEDQKEDAKEEGPDACEKVIGFNEETGNYLVVHYRRGFEARLIQANPEIKRYYSDLKNALLTYEGTKSRLSWTSDNFHNGRRQVAKINVKNGLLVLYLAIDPASLEGTVYRGRDVSDKKKYEETPFEYKIRTPRKLKWGIELIEKASDGMGLTKNAPDPVDYVKKYAFETTEELVNRGLIKETMTEESPADISPELLRRSKEDFGEVEADAPTAPIPMEPDEVEEPQKAPEPVAKEIPLEETTAEETSPEPYTEEEIVEPEPEDLQAEEPEAEPAEEEPEPMAEPEEPAEPEEEIAEPEPEFEPEEQPETEPEPVPEPKPAPKPAPKRAAERKPFLVDNEKNPAFQEPLEDSMAVIDIDEVQGMYRPREVVNLLTLKSKSLIDPRAATLRVVSSSGEALPKQLKVEAERFSLSAMQAICLGDGDVVLLQWRKN